MRVVMNAYLCKKTEFSTRYDNNITIMDLPASLNGNTEIIFRNLLDDVILNAPESHILLNFNEVENINSGNIGEMVRVIWFFQNSQRTLKMCNLSSNIQKIMNILKINERIDVYDSEDKALDSFYNIPVAV